MANGERERPRRLSGSALRESTETGAPAKGRVAASGRSPDSRRHRGGRTRCLPAFAVAHDRFRGCPQAPERRLPLRGQCRPCHERGAPASRL